MARGTPSSQGRAARSEYSESLRRRSEELRATALAVEREASQIEADEARDKAEKETLAKALKDPKAMADKAEINVSGNGVSISINGESLQGYGFSGRYSSFGKGKFDEIFHDMDASLKDNLVTQMMDKGMDKKDAIKAVDLMAEKASTALFGGKPNFEKSIKNKDVQAKIEKAFNDLSVMVDASKRAKETARDYSGSPSDDGSYNLEAAAINQRLQNHIKYVNRLRDEIGHYDIALQYGEKTNLNKQTDKWIENLVYGGALDKAYTKHKDLFID